MRKRNLIAKTYKQYTRVSRDLANAYSDAYGFPCDLYFPVRTPKKRKHNYQGTNLFEPHELPVYKADPDVCEYYFYIPNLLKEESMNSASDQFDNFALQTQGMMNKPFIECSPDDELPWCTKVVVNIEDSKLMYFVDVIHVVNGAGGHMLMRQYLSPLTKDMYIVEGKESGTIKGTKGTTNGINNRPDGARGGLLD